MADRVLTLIGKPGCHLCDDAREVIRSVVAEFDSSDTRLSIVELSILDDEQLRDRFVDDIPVLLIDGEVHTYWQVDPVRLRAALSALPI